MASLQPQKAKAAQYVPAVPAQPKKMNGQVSSSPTTNVTEHVLKDKSLNVEELYAKYELGETLGTGAFSEVKKATCRMTGVKYAIKVIDKAKCKGKENMIQSEVEILKKVKHKNIIRLYDIYESPTKIFLVMELVTGGELFDRIVERGHYTEADAAKIIYEILLGVDYLHDMGICHRDLKPENLLFGNEKEDANIMISDFGLSKIFQDVEVMKTACGTPGYVAPEVLRRQGYGKQVDIWSIGVITYILLCGYPPFYEENNVELFNQIMKGRYEFDSPYWDNISREAKNFVSRMLVVDPNERLTTKDALVHPFLTENSELADKRAKSLQVHTGYSFTSELSTALRKKTDSEKSNLAPTVKSNMQQKILQQKRANAETKETVPTKESKSQTVDCSTQKESQNFGQVIHTIANVKISPRSAPVSRSVPTLYNNEAPLHDNAEVADSAGMTPLRPKAEQREIEDSGIVASLESIKGKQPDPERNARNFSDRNSVGPAKPLDVPTPVNPKAQSHNNRARAQSNDLHNSVFESAADKSHLYTVTPVKGKHSSGHHINVLSYNIFMRPPGLKNNLSDYKNMRLVYFCQNVMPNYDIIALQEMYAYGSSRQNKLIMYAKKLGLNYVLSSPSKGLLNGTVDGGLIILSRYPIVSHSRFTFKKGVYSDRFVAKGALYARIAITPSHHVHVFTTHLQTSYAMDSKITDPDVVVRLNQAIALRHFITQCINNKSPYEPVLLLGDFNVNGCLSEGNDKDSDEYKYLMQILRGENTYIPGCGHFFDLLRNFGVNGHSHDIIPYLKFQDMLKEKYCTHPVTYGDVIDSATKMPAEVVLTAKDDQGVCASLDYIFWMEPDKVHPDGKTLHASLDNVKVEQFKTDGSTEFTQLSDHYGIRCILSLN